MQTRHNVVPKRFPLQCGAQRGNARLLECLGTDCRVLVEDGIGIQ